MFLNFKAEFTQEYTILRDYYVANGDIHGVLFLLKNEESGETFTRFLDKEQLTNEYLWEKVKKEDVDYLSFGVEEGEESKLLVETGFLKTKKKFTKEGTTTNTAKKYRFILKKN